MHCQEPAPGGAQEPAGSPGVAEARRRVQLDVRRRRPRVLRLVRVHEPRAAVCQVLSKLPQGRPGPGVAQDCRERGGRELPGVSNFLTRVHIFLLNLHKI